MLNKFDGACVNNGTRSTVSGWKQGGQGKSVLYSGGTSCSDPSACSALPNILFDAMEMREGAWAALFGFS